MTAARPIFAAALWLLVGATTLISAEVIPPAPRQYFNDYAGVISPETAQRLNAKLEQFERDTSSQILVAVFPRMHSESSIEDYTVRVAEAWKAGQKGKDNGAVLFVFVQDRRLYIQVGYGLEGALPDALAKRIIEEEITPHFRSGSFDAGLEAGVNAILAATRGEYQGTGSTAAGGRRTDGRGSAVAVIGIIIILFVLSSISRGRGRRGMYRRGGFPPYGGWTMGGGGGGFGGGGFGGFSGGGGGFGGGGAGGRW